MIKPSDFLDAWDKTFDIANLWNDSCRQNIINEILWLDQNFENIDALRGHILSCVNFKDPKVNEQYARQVLDYTDKRVQDMAELRAKFLYAQLQNIQKGKIENMPLKIIVRELKLQGR